MERNIHNNGVSLQSEEEQRAFVSACMNLNWSVEHITAEANLPQSTVEHMKWEIINKRMKK